MWEALKQQAAVQAVTAVQSGMVVGLGTGSTAVYAVRAIGERLQRGELTEIYGLPTSEATAREAQALGIPLTTLDEHPVVDVTIDGADEISPTLDLIKGLGGALLREKIVALASRRLIIVADARKQVARLGSRSPLPVEIIPMAQRPLQHYLASLGAGVVRRMQGERPFVTDEGNYILDCHFAGGVEDALALGQMIKAQTGVVEHGLFLGLAQTAVIATENDLLLLGQPIP